MPRRHGPTLGAGTVILEQEAGKTIEPAPTGVTAYVGICEKGNPLELIPAPNQREFLKRCGAYHDGTELPNAAIDLFNLSNGAASAWIVRVTDGNEIQATDLVFDRHTGVGEYVDRFGGDNDKERLLTATLKNGGRWGGAQRVQSSDFTIVSDLTETTLDTGVTMQIDEFKDATLRLFGVTSKTYEIVSNTAAGVLSVKADSLMSTDLANEGDPTNNEAVFFLDNQEREVNILDQRVGDRIAVSLIWKDGEEDQVNLFGLDVLVDNRIVKTYANLSLDSANKWYIGNVVNNDPSNVWVDFTVNFTGTFTATTRPANWSGVYKAFTAATMTMEICRSVVTAVAADPGFVTDFTFPSPNKVVRQRLLLTFTDPTSFDVTSVADFGAEHETLVSGVIDTPYVAGNEFTPGFTVRAGVDAFAAADTILIEVDPLPVELSTGDGILEGSVFVNEGSDTNKVGIESNTPNQITFINNPPSAPTPDSDIATDGTLISSTGVITFPTTAPGDVIVVTDSLGLVTVSPTGAPHADIATLVADYDAAGVIAGLPVGFFSTSVADILDIGGAGYTGSANTGRDNFIRNTVASAELNLVADETITGTVGDRFRVEAPREMRDGYDGDTPSDAQFIAAMNTVTSPLNALRGKNQGLVKLGMPGITTTTIQKQGLTYAESRNYQYRIEIPASILSEPDAINYINNTIGRNDFGKTVWPSYHNVVNPLGNGTILQTVTGMVHGREAKVAKDFRGYHKAAAGTTVTLPGIVDWPLPEDFVIDEEQTNPQGINVILKKKGNWILWGDRTISLDPAWKFAHQREMMSHYENILFENFDWIVFAINDEIEQQRLLPVFQAFFLPEWQKRALRGRTFEEAATFKIDDENNTDLTRAGGDLNAEISLRLADVVERFIITIGKKGIFEQVA